MRVFFGIVVLLPIIGLGQIGGQSAFQSLNLATNPRAAGLAGSTISLADGDVSQFFENPAILDSIEAGNIFFHFNPYFADANIYSLAYSFSVKEMDGFAAGLNYVNFGSFEMRDESGESLGSFSANDYVVTIGKAHRLGPFALGANIKFASSTIDSYSSSALLFDVGGIFQINKNWSMGMVFENIGVKLSDYTELTSPPIPFDVKLGMSFKPEYMPLRFTLTSSNLVDQNEVIGEETTGRSNNGVDKVVQRINIGAELLLSENFQLLFGYNHKRKQELRLEEIGGGAGFSFGLMLNVKNIQLRYSRATYHAAGGTSFISIQTNFKKFKSIL
ncbi:MAG: type IX secretion system protein PorQ [Bacteroidota bacterium]